MRRLLVTCVVTWLVTTLAVLGWGAGPARAETPPSTPRLEVTTAASGTTRFSDGLHDRRALPQYAASLDELVTGRAVGVADAHATRISGSDYETFGFDSAEPLVVGTTYRVTIRVTTVGHFDCPGYADGCTWRRPTDFTYRWTLVLRGSAPTVGTPYYAPVTSSAALREGSWRRGARAARFTGRVAVSPLCLCRTVTVEGWSRGRWAPLRTTGELGAVSLRVPLPVRRIRLVTAAATTTRADGGTVTWPATTSAANAVPRRPG